MELKICFPGSFDRRAVEPGNAVPRVKVFTSRLALVAGLATGGVLADVDGLVGLEPLELPIARAAPFVVIPAPASAFFHDEVPEDLALAVVDQHEVRACRDRLTLFDRLDGL